MVDLFENIKQLFRFWDNHKANDPLLDSCYKYIAGIEQAIVEQRKSKAGEKDFEKLLEYIKNLIKEMETHLVENKKLLFKNEDKKKLIIDRMKLIQEEAIKMKLDISLSVGSQTVSEFTKLITLLEKIKENVPKDEEFRQFSESFISQEAATIWISNFQTVHQVNWDTFDKKFVQYVLATDKIQMKEETRNLIRKLIDRDMDQNITKDEWENFYNRVWCILSQRAKILKNVDASSDKIEKKKLDSKLVFTYVEIDEDCSQYMPAKGSTIELTVEKVTCYENGKVKNSFPKDLSQTAVVLGREKDGIRPDICYDKNCTNVSNKQMEFFVKTNSDVQKGFFVKCVSASNPCSFVVEKTPFYINTNMIVNISQLYNIIIEEVNPAPNQEFNPNPDIFYVDTWGFEKEDEIDKFKQTVINNPGSAKNNLQKNMGSYIKCKINGVPKTLTVTAEQNKFKIGHNEKCDIRIDDKDMVDSEHAFFEFTKNGWVVGQNPANTGKGSSTQCGVYILMKNFREFQSAKQDVPSRGHFLRERMKIFFSYNILEVTSIKKI